MRRAQLDSLEDRLRSMVHDKRRGIDLMERGMITTGERASNGAMEDTTPQSIERYKNEIQQLEEALREIDRLRLA